MTVSTVTSRITYSLSTTGATYATSFRILEDTHVEVQVIRQSDDQAVDLVLDTDYTISGVGDAGGSTIDISLYETAQNVSDWTTYDDGPWTLSIVRIVPYTQENDLVITGKFNSENMEDSLDKLTMLAQQNLTGVTGSSATNLNIQWPNSESTATSNKLPSNASRLGKLAGFNATTGEFEAVSLNTTGAGMQGPATQVDGRLAIFSSTTDLLKDNADIAESLFTTQTLVYGAAVTWDSDLGHIATLNLTGDATLGMSNIKPGEYNLIAIQDSTGGRVITFGGGFSNADNVELDTDSNAITVVKFVSDGTSLYPVGNSVSSKAIAGLVGTYQDFAYDISAVEDDIGYLQCNGQVVSRAKYADLFSKIGTDYNTGGEAGTDFRLPDLETDGRFRRASATVGTEQADATAVNGITADLWQNDSTSVGVTGTIGPGGGTQVTVGATDIIVTTGELSTDGVIDEISTVNEGGMTQFFMNMNGDPETRPTNISCMVGIKF